MPLSPEDWSFATARLLVRPGRVDDAAAVHWIRGQMPWDPQRRDLAGTCAMIEEAAALAPDALGWRLFVMLPRDGGEVLGDMSVRFDHPTPRQAEIGFALHPEARGKGYATEAVGAMIERLFAGGLHRLEALTDARNLPTQRLLTRLRFRQEAHYRQSWPEGDEWSDEFGYARLAGE